MKALDSWKRCRAQAVDAADAWRALAKVKAALGVEPPGPGLQIGRYALIDLLGAGGFGRVYRARDPKLDRLVAIKAVSLHGSRADDARRIVRSEAQALARLSHPNVVNIYDVSSRPAMRMPGPADHWAVFDEHDELFIVMELVDGVTLDQWVDQLSPTADEILDAYTSAGQGLAAAHRANVLHLDFKPGNVMRARDGRVVVLDFGLATLLHDLEDAHATPESGQLATRARSSTRLLGTPRFMPPEQFQSSPSTPAADVYSFGCALHTALCGASTFKGVSVMELYCEKMAGPPTMPRDRIPARVGRVLQRAMAPEPTQRWRSMDAMLTALDRARRSGRARLGWSVATLGVGAAAAFAMAGASPVSPRCDDTIQPLTQRWDAGREGVRRALRTGGATPASAEATVRRVDAHVQAWANDYAAACRADEASTMVERARVCLERSGRVLMSRLDGVVESPSLGRKLSAMLEHIPSGVECGSEELQRMEPQPTDLETMEKITKLQAWADSRNYDRDELAKVDGKIAEAEAIGHRPTLAEVQLHAGYLAAALRLEERAASYYEAAFTTGTAGGADRTAVAAAVSLVGLAPERMPLSDARRWTALALSLTEHLEDTERVEAQADLNLSQALAHAGEFDEAQRRIVGRLEFARAAEADDMFAVRLLYAAGLLALWREDFEGALPYLEQAHERAYGANADDPFSVETTMALASAHRRLGRADVTERLMRAELESTRHPEEVRGRLGLTLASAIAADGSRQLEALALLEELVATAARLYGSNSVAYADTLTSKGQVLIEMQQFDDARRVYRRARSIYVTEEGTATSRLLRIEQGLTQIDEAESKLRSEATP
ncbi:MAG: serine/threonine protein kinase [Deltaproteobacteria bacterium]|nr:serine/threonine protein kinase [Deltaproteobacteria bacterium]